MMKLIDNLFKYDHFSLYSLAVKMSQVWTVITWYFRFGKKIPTWITGSYMSILIYRLNFSFVSKTDEKNADGGTHVRPKEIRPSTGNDVIVQISKNRN